MSLPEKKLRHIASFTLNELLIVIAILAVMAGAVVLVVNPGELLAQARDSTRVGELNSLSFAISLYSNSVVGGYKGEDNTVYVSLPDASSTCANLTDLPDLPSGWSYNCVTEENLQNPDGTGWLPINLNAMPGGSPFEQIPIDPKNEEALTTYYAYVYDSATGNFAVTALLESEKQGVEAYEDGGNDPSRFELGKGLSVWSEATGIVGYWLMNEGVGDVINDSSINNNDGALQNSPQWVDRNNGKAVWFSAASSQKAISNLVYNQLNEFSLFAWINLYSTSPQFRIIMGSSKGNNIDSGLITHGKKVGYHDYVTSGDKNLLSDDDEIELNEWYFVGFTYDDGNIKIYSNGQNVGEHTFVKTDTSANTLIGGASTDSYNGDRMWDGLIDEPLIYNRALTLSEIQSIYNATK